MMKLIGPSISMGGILWVGGALSFPLLGLKVWVFPFPCLGEECEAGTGGIFATSAGVDGWGWGVLPGFRRETCGCEATVSLSGSMALTGMPCRLVRLDDLVFIGWGS